MSFTQLDPALPVTVEDKGAGYAIAVIDYGQEHDLIWVVVLNESGEIWCSPNPQKLDDGQSAHGQRVDGRP